MYRNAVADAENIPHVAPAVLSISQQMAVNQILSEWEQPGSETGSSSRSYRQRKNGSIYGTDR